MTLRLAFLTDPGFLRPTLVALDSALAVAPEAEVHFVGNRLAAADWAAVERVAGAATLLRHELPAEWLAGASSSRAAITTTTLGKFFLPRLIGGRLLYIDGDTLVIRDPTPLMSVDLGGAEIAGVPDWVVSRWVALGRSERLASLDRAVAPGQAARYINGGVLLMECDAMHARPGRLDEMADLAAAKSARTVDQDRLNQIFAGRVAALDPAWNASWGRLRRHRRWIARNGIVTCGPVPGGAAILHFHGPAKPWRPMKITDLARNPVAVWRYRRHLADFRARHPDLAP